MINRNKDYMAAIKLPIKHLEFVKKNPELAQKVGTFLCQMAEINLAIKDLEQLKGYVKDVLTKSDMFLQYLSKDSTEQDLIDFLIDIQQAEDSDLTSGPIEPGDLEEFKRMMGDRIEITDMSKKYGKDKDKDTKDSRDKKDNIDPNLN